MKILYLSVARDGSGYSKAAINDLKCLMTAGIDVVSRCVRLSGYDDPEYPTELADLEKKDLNGVTHTIQFYLPHMFFWNHKTKNIGKFMIETTAFKPSNWQYYLNLMNQTVVASEQNQHACINSGVTKPITVINQATDVAKYSKSYPELPINTKGKFVFYAIGDFSYRKNYTNLIRAYLETFDKRDDVVLILKTYISGVSVEDSHKQIVDTINQIKNRMKKHMTNVYPEIIVLSDRLSNDEIMSLHQQGDCFVTVEHGAGWCLPAFDAYAAGNTVIAPAWGGHTDFLKENTIFLDGELESCFGMDERSCPYTDLYTSHEEWYAVRLNEIKDGLTHAYTAKMGKKTPKNLPDFSYETIGNKWKALLEAC